MSEVFCAESKAWVTTHVDTLMLAASDPSAHSTKPVRRAVCHSTVLEYVYTVISDSGILPIYRVHTDGALPQWSLKMGLMDDREEFIHQQDYQSPWAHVAPSLAAQFSKLITPYTRDMH